MNKTSKQISKALLSINPNFSFVVEGGKIATWYTDDPKPSEEEIVQKVAELEYQEEINEYQRQRDAEYPSYADQFDQIYHEGVDAWKASIQEVKDKYPKATMDAAELQARQDKAIFDLQTERYLKATERLSQYILLEGRPEIREDIVIETKEVFNEETGEIETEEVTENVITQTAIEPLEEFIEVSAFYAPEFDEETMESVTTTIRNPEVVKDEEERAAAQAVVDATPQEVVDAINN